MVAGSTLVLVVAFAGWKLLGTLDEIHETVVVSQDTLRLGRTMLALKNRAIDATVANLAQSSANLERMSRAGAESAEAIRDMLKPTKKAFWRRLLELMIPRPTVRLGR